MSDKGSNRDPEEFLKDREELEYVAENIYEVDHKGIMLNGLIATLGSGLGSLSTYVIGDVSVSLAGLTFIATFTPLFALKVLAEYAKQRAVKEGQIDAYMRGVRESNKLNIVEVSTPHGLWLNLYYILNQACYSRSSLFDGHPSPSYYL